LELSRAEDVELLGVAQSQGRILITRDRDYGSLVFVQGEGGGVIYLRILPTNQSAVHDELDRVLALHSEEELLSSFIVVEAGRHRVRKLRP
jgi:predicted nuclease of predicted toxin-antitoxin system